MKALIDLNGTVTHCDITFYLPEKYMSKQHNQINFSTLTKDGFDYAIKANGVKHCNLGLGVSKSGKPFVLFSTKNPKAVVEPILNCEYRVEKALTIAEWVISIFKK